MFYIRTLHFYTYCNIDSRYTGRVSNNVAVMLYSYALYPPRRLLDIKLRQQYGWEIGTSDCEYLGPQIVGHCEEAGIRRGMQKLWRH